MQKYLLTKKEHKIKNAEKYVFKYFEDLQKHFNLSDAQLIKLLKNCTTNIKNNSNKKNTLVVLLKTLLNKC